VYRREAGRHQKMSVIVTTKQIPDAMISGNSAAYRRASEASTVAARIQSCATLIMMSKISRAWPTAVLPRLA